MGAGFNHPSSIEYIDHISALNSRQTMCNSDNGAIGKRGTKEKLHEGVSFGVNAAGTLALTILCGDGGALKYVPARSFVENNNLSVHQNRSSEAEQLSFALTP